MLYKLHSGMNSTRNDVGVIMDEDMKNKVVNMVQKIYRIMMVKLMFKEKVLNVINAHAPQVGCEEIKKFEFRQEMDQVVHVLKNFWCVKNEDKRVLRNIENVKRYEKNILRHE